MNKNEILRILSDVLKKDKSVIYSTDPHKDLAELDLTSIKFIEFIVALEENFGIEILDSDLLLANFSTINNIFSTLSKYFSDTVSRKVLVVDADNVLWNGICGEEDIFINEGPTELQKLLLDFYNRGVILCLCSKNDQDNIEQAFSLPSMIINKTHFSAWRINRKDKATNIREISEELNLSTDSFIFADDSDYELGFIKLNLPEIHTVKINHPNMSFIDELISMFEHVQSTSDLNRTRLYREQKEREKEKHRFTTVEEYNASLKTSFLCAEADRSLCTRLAELSQRTNQFNLSARKYSENELLGLLDSTDHSVIYLSVRDKYGDMGIVGMSVINKNTIEAFMLSCRVFDRGFENVLLNKIKELAGEPLYGIYRPTDKNTRYADFYKLNGVLTI